MPDGLGGVELAARLGQEKAPLKVGLTSRHAAARSARRFARPAGRPGNHKRCQAQVLARTGRAALDDNFNR